MKAKISRNIYFYLVLLLLIACIQISWRTVTSFFPDIPDEYGSRFIEAIMSIAAVFLWKTTDFVQPFFGLKVEKGQGKKTAVTCILIAAGITAAYIAARLILQNFIPEIAARPFFKTYINVKMRKVYFLVAILEEMLSKGVLQYGTEKTLPEENWKTAVLISSAVFGMLHIHHTPYYIFGAMVLAAVSGVLYHKQGNIWASAVLHFFLAFLPRCFGLK